MDVVGKGRKGACLTGGRGGHSSVITSCTQGRQQLYGFIQPVFPNRLKSSSLAREEQVEAGKDQRTGILHILESLKGLGCAY